MFPAFLKMRKVDPNRKRVFTFPFKGKLMYVMLAIPAIELVLAIIATIVPLNGSEEELSKIPMLIGVIVFVVLGEVVRIWSKRGRTEEYKGLTPALAAERLAEEAAEEAADEAEAPEAKGRRGTRSGAGRVSKNQAGAAQVVIPAVILSGVATRS